MPSPLPFPKDIQNSEPEVFIIESLGMADEISKRYEGRALSEHLKLLHMRPLYYYCRKAVEVKDALDLFCHSKYRWLHISAHGSPDSIATTLEIITNQEFNAMCAGNLKNRRIFFSACEVGCGGLPTLLKAANQGMYSIAAPMNKPTFGQASAFWNAFYSITIMNNRFGMEASVIVEALEKLAPLFKLPINWEWYDPHPKSKCWKQQIFK